MTTTKRFSTKKIAEGDGWRPHIRFKDAVAGANDTGMWDDSPCRSDVSKAEIKAFCEKLKAAGIPYMVKMCESSNCMMMSRQVIVHPEDHDKAYEIAVEHKSGTQLFYPEEKIKEKVN